MTPNDILTDMMHTNRKQKMREMGVKTTDRVRRHPENDAMREVMGWLKERRIFFFRVNNIPAQYGPVKVPVHTRGISDIIAVLHGHTVFIEVKRFDKKGRQSEDQVVFQSNVERNGGRYVLVDSIEKLEEYVTRLL